MMSPKVFFSVVDMNIPFTLLLSKIVLLMENFRVNFSQFSSGIVENFLAASCKLVTYSNHFRAFS